MVSSEHATCQKITHKVLRNSVWKQQRNISGKGKSVDIPECLSTAQDDAESIDVMFVMSGRVEKYSCSEAGEDQEHVVLNHYSR